MMVDTALLHDANSMPHGLMEKFQVCPGPGRPIRQLEKATQCLQLFAGSMCITACITCDCYLAVPLSCWPSREAECRISKLAVAGWACTMVKSKQSLAEVWAASWRARHMPHYEIWKYCQNTTRTQAQVLQKLKVCRNPTATHGASSHLDGPVIVSACAGCRLGSLPALSGP